MTPEDLRQRVAALKHDLGKYVAWMSSNLPADDWDPPVTAAVLDALQNDILRTGKRDGRDEAAWVVWDRLTVDLERPFPAPEFDAVEHAVHRLKALESALQDRDIDVLSGALADIRAAQGEIRTNLARLHRRLQEV